MKLKFIKSMLFSTIGVLPTSVVTPIILSSCGKQKQKTIPVNSVSLDTIQLKLVEGQTTKLAATVLPENATNKNVTWSSSDESIAIVDQNGNVTAKTPGIATITVTTEDGNKTAICEVTVNEYISVESVEINESTLDLPLAWEHQLTATILPWNANNRGVTWTSSNEFVATVDSLTGKVTAKNPGTTTITVTTWDGLKSDTCEVTVKEHIPVESVEINESTLDLPLAWEHQLTATILPWNANNRGVTWTSSNEFVATVDSLTGYVTAKNPGTATITVTTWDGLKSDTCEVTVSPLVEVGKNYDTWGNITVKYKLLSNHECRLLTKFNGEDSENGYVDGAGVLRIPDHVVYNGEIYYVRRIPSEWSDGSNNIEGIEFASDVSHLKEICDYAFKGTNALDNYVQANTIFDDWDIQKVCTFPEGLEYIGTESFYNVDMSQGLIAGYVFPSTLNAISVRAFANAPLIGFIKYVKKDWWNPPVLIKEFPATLTFKGNFDPNNIGEDAFSALLDKNYVRYVYAPAVEIAANIANYIRVVCENDFTTEYIWSDCPVIEPRTLGS